jgi:hypothetical protein
MSSHQSEEARLVKELERLIVGEKVDVKRLYAELREFFHTAQQEDIDAMDKENLEFFLVSLDILKENETLSPFHLANLDHARGSKASLKYSWKSCDFDLARDQDAIQALLNSLT